MGNVIGRTEEKLLLHKIAQSGQPELVAVYGRRRVGKTFLIRSFYQKQLAFEFSGLHHASHEQQLENFRDALSNVIGGGITLEKPASWIHAFKLLENFLTPRITKNRKVIFFDEFPWINTPRSGFLMAFENFWNNWASKQSNLIIVICGSSAAWMIQKVINNKGGLHNRVTRKLRLLPFTLKETKQFLSSRHCIVNNHQLLQLYMAMGGVPHYLKEVEKGESAAQIIDRVCFTKDGLLNDEFKNLFYSLFDNASNHIGVIRALAKQRAGLSRKEIIDRCELTSGGEVSQLLEELTESGFITPSVPFNKTKKDAIYRLTDEYSLFYLKFIENKRAVGSGTWSSFCNGASWRSWSGLAFESIIIKHSNQLKKALGIENVYAEVSSWRKTGSETEKGCQIDLIIDRNDNCINLCEIKFSESPFVLTKSYAEELLKKVELFRSTTKTRKTIFLTMITSYGLSNNKNNKQLIQQEVKLSDLLN